MQTLYNDRLILKELSLKDSDAVYAVYADPKVRNSYNITPIPTKEATPEFIKNILDEGNRVWTIRLQDEPDRIIGLCSLHNRDRENKTAELGGTLLSDYWGRDIMQEAFTLIMQFAKEDMGLKKVIGKARTMNQRAVRLIEKMGFRDIGSDQHETVMEKVVG